MGTEGKPSAGDRLLELVLGRFLPRWVSLPLLLVLALFRALRFERGLAYLRRGGVGLFYFVDTLWFVGTVTLLCALVFGRKAYGFGLLAGLLAFVLIHSLIAHAADYYAGYSPGAEFLVREAKPKDGQGSGGPEGGSAGKGGVDAPTPGCGPGSHSGPRRAF
jgi:hypothetical protein